MSSRDRALAFARSVAAGMKAKGMVMWRDEIDDAAFVPIEDEASLAPWLARPGPALVLLHDPYCPISAAAYREVARLPGPVALIDVAAAPELSDAVEARTGIRHESPQIILLRDGEPVWSASHYRVTESGIVEAVATTETTSRNDEPSTG